MYLAQHAYVGCVDVTCHSTRQLTRHLSPDMSPNMSPVIQHVTCHRHVTESAYTCVTPRHVVM